MKADPSVSRGLSVTAARRLSVGLIAIALGASALVSAPAHAQTRTGAAPAAPAATPCLHPTSRATKWREAGDTDNVSARIKAEVASVVASAASPGDSPAQARTTAAGHITVPVIIHLIHGHLKHEHRIGKYAARRMFRTLKAGYAGAQDPTMAPTGVSFKLRKITVSRNEKWFHAAPYGRADRQMKHKLHRGKARVLNVYVNRPKSQGQLLLGFSVFPWQRAARSKLDGVTISDIGLPGGRATGYNLGDTVIHETGHWLGLLHTFEGGCATGEGGDGVADTPAEAVPSFRCDDRDTCPIPEYVDPANPTGPPVIDAPDPIHNFMDYSYDACMYQFTPGQSARMLALFNHYRYGH